MSIIPKRLLGIGMSLFLFFIGIAAALYPGGNRFDKQHPGYSFQGNFLCDLFDRVAYNGVPNEGRFYAIFGTYDLALTLILFWILLPNLFDSQAITHQRYVRILGVVAMTISLLIATPLHDLSILLAVPIGLIAFIGSILELKKNHEKTLALLGLISIATCTMNYFSLILHLFPRFLPGIQKLALISFLVWVNAGIYRINRKHPKN